MKDITAKLIADAVCWIALTVWLVWTGLVVVAAMVGSFGIIYLYNGIKAIIHIRYVNKRFEEFMGQSDEDKYPE